MQNKPDRSPESAELRRHAEERLQEQHAETGQARNDPDAQRLVHELQVHQIELEMQNEELQLARDEMEAALERYADLYDFAPVGYLTLDREGTIRQANLACASLLGIEGSRLVQRRLGLFVSAGDRNAFASFLTVVFASKVREYCEVTLLKEGKLPVDVRIGATVAASGQECRAVLEDITEQRRAEEDRLILNKLESMRILAGGMAHDFNNLLTVILLNLELAQDVALPGDTLAGRLEEATKAGWMARGLTKQLITFAKGGQPIRKLARLPRVIEESGRLAVSGSRVRCEFSLGADLWPAEVDAGQIGQVIQNIVLNAREAMPGGGVVSVWAENVVLGSHEHPPLPPGDYVRVSIADHGVGMAKEVQSKIFDPYFSTKQRGSQKGMGLGLTICHAVMQKHGGAISVESEPGVGSTFRLLLPASRKLIQEEKAPAPAGLARPGKILVMEDEAAVRTLVGNSLQRMGHAVELVEDGQAAVEAFARAGGLGRPFDLVILDLTVRAGVGGREAIQALLKIDPGVKAIVMSGHADDPVILEPERYGFKGVLAKPFQSVKLREVLAQVLGSASVEP
jgi:PAS domain S-box-containing protein